VGVGKKGGCESSGGGVKSNEYLSRERGYVGYGAKDFRRNRLEHPHSRQTRKTVEDVVDVERRAGRLRSLSIPAFVEFWLPPPSPGLAAPTAKGMWHT
jgi:hypothetical protein